MFNPLVLTAGTSVNSLVVSLLAFVAARVVVSRKAALTVCTIVLPLTTTAALAALVVVADRCEPDLYPWPANPWLMVSVWAASPALAYGLYAIAIPKLLRGRTR